MSISSVGEHIDDRPEEGIFRVRRDVFSDPELFELEMKHVFGKTWVFLGLESQIRKPNDFLSTWIGTTPVLVMRDAKSRIGAFVNVCPHKGAVVAQSESGSTKYHVCPYHGWAFDCAGKNINIKDESSGAYPSAFQQESHDLKPVARVGVFEGLVFGSLSEDVPSLDDFLGDLRPYIELAMQQGAQGMEVIPGRAAYTFRGNWKLQMDNGLDAYHLTSTHSSFMDVLAKRRSGDGYSAARQFDWDKRLSQEMGVMAFKHGHAANWMNQAEVEKRPIFPVIDEVRARLGNTKADWMLKGRSLTVFPNMQIADQTSLNLRTFRPISVNLTEMRVYCLAPIGEAPNRREWRLRQFEDFFNACGLATPDDTVTYEMVQRGCSADNKTYLQGYYRGLGTLQPGASSDSLGEVGVFPAYSQHGAFDCSFETALHAHYREWRRLMEQGLGMDGAAK